MVDLPDPRLTGLHVCRAWFVEMDLPAGTARFHNGTGTQTVAGVEWHGVSDPIGGRMAVVQSVREPYLGEASAAQITLIGADPTFLRSIHDIRNDIEGRACSIKFGVFDQESQTMIGGFFDLIPRGFLSAPVMHRSGIGVCVVTLTVESMWGAKNFAPGGRWNGAGQRERFPGDLGLNFIGHKIIEEMK